MSAKQHDQGTGGDTGKKNDKHIDTDDSTDQNQHIGKYLQQIDFFAGTVKEAQEEGYAFASDFTDAEAKDVSRAGMPDGCEKQQVIIIREPMQVLVPGTIQYVSKNMKVVNKSQARLSADEGTDDESHVTTQAYGYVIYTDNN